MRSTLTLALLLCAVLPAWAGAEDGVNALQTYLTHCSGCHDRDGSGLPRQGIPDFRGTVASFSYVEEGRKYLMHVPGVVGNGLTDREVAVVLNYVMNAWGGKSLQADFTPFTEAEVTRLRNEPVDDVVKYRRLVVQKLQEKDLPVAAYPWP